MMQKCKEQFEKVFFILGVCQVNVVVGDSVLIFEGWWYVVEGVDGFGVGVNVWFRQ